MTQPSRLSPEAGQTGLSDMLDFQPPNCELNKVLNAQLPVLQHSTGNHYSNLYVSVTVSGDVETQSLSNFKKRSWKDLVIGQVWINSKMSR